jgi:hypothetical protein
MKGTIAQPKLTSVHAGGTGTPLPNEKFLVMGGFVGTQSVATTEVFDPTTGMWSPGDLMLEGRRDFTSTLLPNGQVLSIGGKDNSGILSTTEVYTPGCTTGGSNLCLSNRFRTTAAWATPDGQSGMGTAGQLTSDSGTFWFFGPTAIEAVVKVVNGCGFNSRYWLFAGGLTNVSVILTVTDTATSTVRTYFNPQNTAFQPIQDTAAFATCP